MSNSAIEVNLDTTTQAETTQSFQPTSLHPKSANKFMMQQVFAVTNVQTEHQLCKMHEQLQSEYRCA
jgi:hypothetical protein